jgi:hypothetical protein
VQTQTDFLIASEEMALTGKLVAHANEEQRLAAEWLVDIAYYARQPNCRVLLGVAYDPLGAIPDPRRQETAWSRSEGTLQSRWLIAES